MKAARFFTVNLCSPPYERHEAVFVCTIGAPKNFGSREGVVILLGRAWAEDGRSRYGEGGMEGDVRGRAAAGRTAPLRTPREALSPDPVQRSGLENLRICPPGRFRCVWKYL